MCGFLTPLTVCSTGGLLKNSMRFFLIAFILFNGVLVSAQPQDPQTDPDAVPISGIEYLLIGGGAYGVSRLLKNRTKRNNES